MLFSRSSLEGHYGDPIQENMEALYINIGMPFSGLKFARIDLTMKETKEKLIQVSLSDIPCSN